MIDYELVEKYYQSAIYALSIGTDPRALQYAELVYAEDNNLEAAIAFRDALKIHYINPHCSVVPPIDIEFTTDDQYDEDEEL